MSANESPEEYVEKYIEYNFKNHSILQEAVRQPENRRLGMLGDKVIGMVVLDACYRTPGLNCDMARSHHDIVDNVLMKLRAGKQPNAVKAAIARWPRKLDAPGSTTSYIRKCIRSIRDTTFMNLQPK